MVVSWCSIRLLTQQFYLEKNMTVFNSPNSKRRRLVDTWSNAKGYDDKPIRVPNPRQRQNIDPMEDLGREHWMHSSSFPIHERPLCTNMHMGKWCYYVRQCSTDWESIQNNGVAGVHFAIGYTQLGEMIIRYGSDYSLWPSLPQPWNVKLYIWGCMYKLYIWGTIQVVVRLHRTGSREDSLL